MVRDFQCIGFHAGLGLKTGNGGLQNRQHHIAERLPRPLFRGHFLCRICRVVIAGNFKNGLTLVTVKANGTLVSSLLPLLIQIEAAAQIERVGRRHGQDVGAHLLQVVHVLLLQRTQLWVFHLDWRNDLGKRGCQEKEERQSQPANSSHTPIPECDKADLIQRGYKQSAPVSPIC